MNEYSVLLNIKPESYGVAQRVEASAMATAMGRGLLMELHSSHTEFYAETSIPIGKVAVWMPPRYKANPEYVTTLDSPEQPWSPEQSA